MEEKLEKLEYGENANAIAADRAAHNMATALQEQEDSGRILQVDPVNQETMQQGGAAAGGVAGQIAPPAPIDIPMSKVLRFERDTLFGNSLAAYYTNKKLAKFTLELDLTEQENFNLTVEMLKELTQFTDAEEVKLSNIIAQGLPFFIKNEIKDDALNQLRFWQSRFWFEAKHVWRETNQKKLLGVFATGTGKSLIIAMAPYLGARERCLVVVPNNTLLEGMRVTLGAPWPLKKGEARPDNSKLPALVDRGLIAAAQMPKVLILPDLGPPKATYIYMQGGYNPTNAERTMIEIILDHDIVISTAQTLTKVSEKKKTAGEPDKRLMDMHDWIVKEKKLLFDLVIFDEAHHIQSRTWGEIRDLLGGMNDISHTNLLLVTATPFHMNGDLDASNIRDAGPTTASGLKWQKLGSEKPNSGKEIPNSSLLAAGLRSKLVFSATELEGFKLKSSMTYIPQDNFVEVDGEYYKPASGTGISPYTLIDAYEQNGGSVVKGVVFLNIQNFPGENTPKQTWKMDVLKLVGNTLRSKMDAEPHIQHRALVLVNKKEDAEDLVRHYNNLSDAEKPQLNGRPFVVASYFGPIEKGGAAKEEMEQRLIRFQITSGENPIHILIQVGKLGEGYDQPNISVVGICSEVGKVARFAQFCGRSVRKLGTGSVEDALVSYVSNVRDNISHVITHERFRQLENWKTFTTQQGVGEFDPDADGNEDDEDADDAAQAGSSSKEPESKTDMDADMEPCVSLGKKKGGGSQAGPPAKQQKINNAPRVVHRFALARTEACQGVILDSEKALHDDKPYLSAGWKFVNRTINADRVCSPIV